MLCVIRVFLLFVVLLGSVPSYCQPSQPYKQYWANPLFYNPVSLSRYHTHKVGIQFQYLNLSENELPKSNLQSVNVFWAGPLAYVKSGFESKAKKDTSMRFNAGMAISNNALLANLYSTSILMGFSGQFNIAGKNNNTKVKSTWNINSLKVSLGTQLGYWYVSSSRDFYRTDEQFLDVLGFDPSIDPGEPSQDINEGQFTMGLGLELKGNINLFRNAKGLKSLKTRVNYAILNVTEDILLQEHQVAAEVHLIRDFDKQNKRWSHLFRTRIRWVPGDGNLVNNINLDYLSIHKFGTVQPGKPAESNPYYFWGVGILRYQEPDWNPHILLGLHLDQINKTFINTTFTGSVGFLKRFKYDIPVELTMRYNFY